MKACLPAACLPKAGQAHGKFPWAFFDTTNKKELPVKAAMLTAMERMEVREVPTPTLQKDDQVLIRVEAVGVCGSDVHYFSEGCIGSQVVEYPWTIGHECAGTVVQAGPAAHLAPGDRVAVDPLLACTTCDQCRTGRENTCRSQQFLGNPHQASGAMAQYLVMPARSCVVLGETVSFVEGALCEPLAIGVYAARMARLAADSSVAILGSGPIGLSVLLALRAQALGNLAVFATDLLDYRLDFAGRFGADHLFHGDDSDLVAQVRDHCPLGMDAVFECAGRQETIDQGLALLKPGGTLFLIGIPTSKTVTFDFDLARREEIALQPVRRQNHCAQLTVDLVAQGKIDVLPMATHTFPLEQAQQAVQTAQHYRDGVIKAIIEPWS